MATNEFVQQPQPTELIPPSWQQSIVNTYSKDRVNLFKFFGSNFIETRDDFIEIGDLSGIQNCLTNGFQGR